MASGIGKPDVLLYDACTRITSPVQRMEPRGADACKATCSGCGRRYRGCLAGGSRWSSVCALAAAGWPGVPGPPVGR